MDRKGSDYSVYAVVLAVKEGCGSWNGCAYEPFKCVVLGSVSLGHFSTLFNLLAPEFFLF